MRMFIFLAVTVLSVSAQPTPPPAPGSWSTAHEETSCERSPSTSAGTGLSLAQCQAACVENSTCMYINYAASSDEHCLLFSECTKPWCQDGPDGGWWTVYQYGRQGSQPFPGCPPTGPAGKLVKVGQDVADRHGAKCLDGTVPAFYIWADSLSHSIGTDKNKFVLFLEGGAWCFSEQDCLGRSKGALGSTKGDASTMKDMGGIMSMLPSQNPGFSNWTKVFVRYCDGSSFSGNAAEASAANQLWYRGRPNLNAVVDELTKRHGLDSATEVILSGGSAGGLAVYLQLDHVASLLPSGTRLTGFPDAGYFADLPNTKGEFKYRGSFQGADPIWNSTAGGGTNLACLTSVNSSSSWQCLMAQYVVPHLKTPVFVMNAAIDVYQMQEILQVGCVPSDCSDEQFALMEQYRKSFVKTLAPVLARKGNGCWVDSCLMHEQNVYYCSAEGQPGGASLNCQGWLHEEVQGITPQLAFAAYYYQLAVDPFWIDTLQWPASGPQNKNCSWHFAPQLSNSSSVYVNN